MPFRAHGRPQKRWDDILRQFCEHIYDDDFWFGHARQYATWFPLEHEFAMFCQKHFSL